MTSRIRRGLGVILAAAALMLAVSCSFQVIQPAPDPQTDPAAYTQYKVNQAIAYYKANGRDAAVAYYNTPESVDGQWYVFIGDANDVMSAHATVPENVGMRFADILGLGGYPSGAQVAAAATEEGAWTTYTYFNAATDSFQTKHTWVLRYDGVIIGSGWYEDGVSKSDPAAYTQEFVQQAIRLYDAVGRDAAFAYYNTPESVDEDWYIFIIDENDNTIIHPTRPEIRGTTSKMRLDITGYAYGYDLVNADEAGKWVSYFFTNPQTGYEDQKHTWAIKHDGYIFASGWYERDVDVDDATYTQFVVHRAIQRYDAQGLEATLAYFNSEESVDGQWYVFVLDENQVTISHYNPEHIGRTREMRIDARGYDYGADFLKATEAGAWIDYVFLNPETEKEMLKHTWLRKHDGLFFGSGWYEEVKEE